MDQRSETRSFWEVYTLPNIWNEVKLRLAAAVDGRMGRQTARTPMDAYDPTHASDVGHFYDAHHEDFLKVYGEVIQAFRTRNIEDLLNYQITSIGLTPGMRALDAGCGNGVPATYFARHAQADVDGITVSRRQYETMLKNISIGELTGRVTAVFGDYHELTRYFPAETYDVVYFLESFGHSRAKRRAIEQCWAVLKPGGTLYIKDLFRRVPLRPEHKRRIDREIQKINEAYRYDVADLNAVLNDLRGTGFLLTWLKTIDFSLEQFEDLAISNQFQELTGLARIENWNEYVFPVEFFEIKCVKPEFSLDERLDRYFLQQRYHLAMDNKPV